jgi:hypothetical protein
MKKPAKATPAPVATSALDAAPEVASEAQRPPAEVLYAAELESLRASDSFPKPPGWRLSPRAVRTFILGDEARGIRKKFVGHPSLVDRAMIVARDEPRPDADRRAGHGQVAAVASSWPRRSRPPRR